MRDPARIPRILAKIQALWEATPDLRLGQLLTALIPPGRDIFYIEDDWLEDRIPEVPRKPPMGGNPCGEIPLEQEPQPCVLPRPEPVVNRSSLEQKAHKAIRLAKATLGNDATMQDVEDQAFQFMGLDDADLNARLALVP